MTGCRWAEKWFKLLQAQGLGAGGGAPLLPSPRSQGQWSTRPLPCDQANSWLSGSQGRNIGTHSCKRRTTGASWGTTCRPLQGSGTELLYAANAQAAPLSKLQSVIDQVRKGSFRPDRARGDQLVGEAPPEVVENDCGGEDVVSSSEDSADEEQPDRAADELAEAEALGSWDGRVDISKLKESDIYFRNQLSRVIHTLADEAGNSLTCGRAIMTAYERLQERPKVMFPRCKQCFRMLVA